MIKEEKTCMACGCLLSTLDQKNQPKHVCIVGELKKMVKEDPHIWDDLMQNVFWKLVNRVAGPEDD